jgi:hypothetical protein
MGPNEFSAMLTCPRRVTLWVRGDQGRDIPPGSKHGGGGAADPNNIDIMKGNLLHDSIQGLFVGGSYSEGKYEEIYGLVKSAAEQSMWTEGLIEILDQKNRTMEAGTYIHKEDLRHVYKAIKKFRKYLIKENLLEHNWKIEETISGTVGSEIWGGLHLEGKIDLFGRDTDGGIVMLELKSSHHWKDHWRTQIELYGLMRPDSVNRLIVWSPRRTSSTTFEDGIQRVNQLLNPKDRNETKSIRWVCQKCPDTLCGSRSQSC